MHIADYFIPVGTAARRRHIFTAYVLCVLMFVVNMLCVHLLPLRCVNTEAPYGSNTYWEIQFADIELYSAVVTMLGFCTPIERIWDRSIPGWCIDADIQ